MYLLCLNSHSADLPQVEDLFYNVQTRRRAFRSASEEYAKILDLVGRYAVHCTGVAFSCKKHGESSMGISVPANATTSDRIRQVHGSAVANELIKFEVANERWGFKSEGLISNANYSVKRTTFLLFINHRSVDSSAIKKAVEQTYSTFLPKGGHPFMYLSLEIDPARVDVNVHPTKREVNFLNEEEIMEEICDEIRSSLGKVDTSLLPSVKTPSLPRTETSRSESGAARSPADATPTQRPSTQKSQKPYENNLVRTDARTRKITTMLPAASHPSSDDKAKVAPQSNDMHYEEDVTAELTLCKLSSIKNLRAAVREEMHNGLTDVFATHTFVGIVDERRRIAAIQGGVKLYLVDYGMLCNEYFYQVGLTDFGNFGKICFNPTLKLTDLLSVGAAYERDIASSDDDEIDWEEVVAKVGQQLIDRRAMILEYFSMEITEEGDLLSIPLLMKGYMPSLAKLPQFLLRLGPHVNWRAEKDCFDTFLKELASFYVPEALPPAPGPNDGSESDAEQEDEEISARRKHVVRALENIMFPAFKSRLVATKGLLKGVIEVTDLKRLYRVFERC